MNNLSLNVNSMTVHRVKFIFTEWKQESGNSKASSLCTSPLPEEDEVEKEGIISIHSKAWGKELRPKTLKATCRNKSWSTSLLTVDLWDDIGLQRKWCHQESNTGHLALAASALATELWCSADNHSLRSPYKPVHLTLHCSCQCLHQRFAP